MAGHSFTTPDGCAVFIDYADACGSAVVSGREWRWEFHRYLGPLWLKKDGEPRACQCPTIEAVWDAFDEWHKRFDAEDKRRLASMQKKRIRPTPVRSRRDQSKMFAKRIS